MEEPSAPSGRPGLPDVRAEERGEGHRTYISPAHFDGRRLLGFRIRRLADKYGFDRVSVGDTQLNNLECFTALTVAAVHSERVHLGPGVTNPVTRDLGVMANVLSSLQVVSGGRAFCLMARGDGAVRNAGLGPASVTQMRGYLVALRELLHTGLAHFGEIGRASCRERV